MFENARLKLERAYQHGLELQQAFAAFAFAHPYRAMVNLDVQCASARRVWVDIEATAPLPAKLGLMLGDAIHNMCCALDHMTWELIGLDGGTQNRHLQFPRGDTRINYEAMARGMITPRQDTKQFFVDLAAYRGGAGQLLYGLYLLDNADKHAVITPVAHASQVNEVTFINLATGERKQRGPFFTEPTFDRTALLIEAEAGWGIDATENIDPIPDIFFGKVDIVQDEPVGPALAGFHTAVESAVQSATEFVATRS